MKKRDHATVVDARRALISEAFVTEFSSPNRPECWRRCSDPKKKRYAIAREDRDRSTKWHIVDYPGDPVQDRMTANEILVNADPTFSYLE